MSLKELTSLAKSVRFNVTRSEKSDQTNHVISQPMTGSLPVEHASADAWVMSLWNHVNSSRRV